MTRGSRRSWLRHTPASSCVCGPRVRQPDPASRAVPGLIIHLVPTNDHGYHYPHSGSTHICSWMSHSCRRSAYQHPVHLTCISNRVHVAMTVESARIDARRTQVLGPHAQLHRKVFHGLTWGYCICQLRPFHSRPRLLQPSRAGNAATTHIRGCYRVGS